MSCAPEILHLRASALRTIRQFFDDRNYTEVTTPILSRDTVVDAQIDPLSVRDPRSEQEYFLQTSPEAAMKRLLASGSGSIYQITPVVRGLEQGSRHNPEFTMVEWYGLHTDDGDQRKITEALVRQVHREIATRFPDSLALPTLPAFRETTYDQAFADRLGMSVLSATDQQLFDLVRKHCGTQFGQTELSRDELLNLLLAECIEPDINQNGPLFLTRYPVSQAALAVRDPDDPRTARRFELYLGGMEICNGYQELTDADELRQREGHENLRRRQRGATQLPGASAMHAAIKAGMPNCAGVALGFERLLMALTGASNIAEVITFPFESA